MVVSGGSSQQPSPAPPPPPDVNNIMGGIEQTVGVRMHNHRRKLRQRFDLVRKLGQGTYGKVQLGINKETGQEVAIKTIKKAKIETEADLIRIRREIQIMSSVRHPNIIHIYEVFENKEKMVLVMEYAAGGELYDYLSQRKVLAEAEARRVFRQVASAVYYCHKHNICHRDLKLENILLDESKTAKIADFGLSNVFDDRRLLTTFCGSPLYASPEIVRGTPYHGPEVDCWSLGVLLYTLVYGAMPFDGSNFKRLVKQISSGEYYEPPDKPSTASPLVRHMLLVDPSKRATVEDICSHWWVNEGYGESCLEVAEELANQTPVRLDLLLSLVPPPESTETVVVGTKMDVSQSSAAKEVEGDSMNEYYSAVKDQTGQTGTETPSEPASSTTATKSGVKKKKDGTTETNKKRRSETTPKPSAGPVVDPPRPVATQELASPVGLERAEDLESSAGPSPIDDSGIQTSEREEVTTEAVACGGETDRAEVTSKPEAKPNVTEVDVDEGISTSSSWTRATADASRPTRLHPDGHVRSSHLVKVASGSVAGTSPQVQSSTNPSATTPVVQQQEQENPSAFRQSSTTLTDSIGMDEEVKSESALEIVAGLGSNDGTTTSVPSPSSIPPAGPSALVTCIPTGQSESQLVASKMDAEESVPAAAVVALTEPENAASPSPSQPAQLQPPAPNQVPSPAAADEDDHDVAVPVGGTESSSSNNKNQGKVIDGPSDSTVANRRLANSNNPTSSGPAEQRHSKILRQAEIFNSLMLTHSRNEPPPKSTMTLERPKKVTIYGYKLNDTRRAFETRTEPKVPTIVPVLKVSDAKRAFENSVAKSEQSLRNSTTSSHSHNSLPRRTLIQTPPSISTDSMLPKPQRQTANTTGNNTAGQEAERLQSAGVQPGEKVVVGGLGVKIGAIGKVTEIGMNIKTEENHQPPLPQKTLKSKSGSSTRETKPKAGTESKAKEETSESGPVPVSQGKKIPSPVKETAMPNEATPLPASGEPKVREIQVMLDTGESEPKMASMLVATSPSPPKDPPTSSPARPTSLQSPSKPAKVSSIRSPTERVSSPPPRPVRIASPPPRPVRIASPPPAAISTPTKTVSVASARPLSPPLLNRATSPRPLSPPPAPVSRPMSPVYASAALPADRTEDDCIAGSENAFIRGIRSPTRDHPLAVSASKRFSKGPAEFSAMESEAKPVQKSEINIAVSTTSLSAAPRERIIPIRVEGRETANQPIGSVTTVAVAANDIKTLPKSINSISVQLRATPPRLTSPPPVLPIRPSRQESVQPAVAESSLENKLMIREPIRKSPREFIIPITVEGGGASVSSNPTTAETSSSSSSIKTNRFDRTKRYGSLYHEGETDFDQPSDEMDPISPLHHLQRLSSFKKSHEESDTRGRRGSGSSIDDDDDDDETFQILTAESLFSTLLSRVRQLTRRNQRAENPTDPFVVFRNASRFTSPAPSNGSRSRTADPDGHRDSEDTSQMSSPGCTSPTHHNNNNRNSTGSDLLAGAASNKAFWNNIYSRASSVASESDARRYSTLDPPRFYGENQPIHPSSAGQPATAPWRRETSVEGESNCSIASASVSPRGTTFHSPADVNGEDFNTSSTTSSRPFTSSLTRRILNQHLKETNPELAQGSQNGTNSDAMSETSSASGGNRSSLSWALSRLTGVLPPAESRNRRESPQKQQYSRTHSSRELGNEQGETRRTYQRYGRSSTLDNIDPASASGPNVMQRIGSPLSDEDQSGILTPASYRTYTRTRSREYLSPNSSRGTSPVPLSTGGASNTSPDAVVMNPIVPQLSTVLENGPLGVEGESSPRPVRAAETKLAVITNLNTATNPPSSNASSSSGGNSTTERKSRRISRFLRPDFYDAPKEDPSTEKQRFLKSVEQRWEKYNPDAGLMALPKTSNVPVERIIPILKPTPVTTPSTVSSATPSSPLQPILQARQNLTPIPISQPAQPSSPLPPPVVTLKPVTEPVLPVQASKIVNGNVESQPVPAQQQSVPAQQQPIPAQQQSPPSPPQPSAKVNGTKSSPKLTVRRQFEHLINLAAAQFSRGQSPSKVPAPSVPALAPNPAPVPSITPPISAPVQQTISQSDAISMELKQLEDEIKNTAAIKAQATARLDALKHELAVKSGVAAPVGLPPPKPNVPAKPDYLSRPPVAPPPVELPIPLEFQPFQYKGSNGVLRELSHLSHSRRDTLSPPSFPATTDSNGRTPPPEGDESVRFARIKRVDQPPFDNSWANDALDTPGTPTDSYESSSVCSDLRGDQRGDSGEDESVSERIFRKSFYTRFNEPGKSVKSKHHQHRRSMNREMTPSGGEYVNDSSASEPPPAPISRRSSQHRKSLSGRDESAEAVMVRKFLSSGDSSTTHFERERRLSSSRRPHIAAGELGDGTDHHPVGSREPSVARSVKSDQQQSVASPTPSISSSDANGRESRSYSRTYSSRGLSNDPPSNVTSPGESYSSASLGRRSYYQSSTTNADHISSLPRRSNRYSIQEPENGVRLRSTGSVLASRSSYVNPPSSRYSSILFEESGNNSSATTTASNVLSPNSARRHPNLSDALTRRESTFYGTPSSHLSSRSGSASGSTYFMRSTSSGLDHHHNANNNTSSAASGAAAYATMRPSILRHRR